VAVRCTVPATPDTVINAVVCLAEADPMEYELAPQPLSTVIPTTLRTTNNSI